MGTNTSCSWNRNFLEGLHLDGWTVTECLHSFCCVSRNPTATLQSEPDLYSINDFTSLLLFSFTVTFSPSWPLCLALFSSALLTISPSPHVRNPLFTNPSLTGMLQLGRSFIVTWIISSLCERRRQLPVKTRGHANSCREGKVGQFIAPRWGIQLLLFGTVGDVFCFF